MPLLVLQSVLNQRSRWYFDFDHMGSVTGIGIVFAMLLLFMNIFVTSGKLRESTNKLVGVASNEISRSALLHSWLTLDQW